MFTYGFERFTEQEIPSRECQGSYLGEKNKYDAYLDIIKGANIENYTPKGLMSCYCL